MTNTYTHDLEKHTLQGREQISINPPSLTYSCIRLSPAICIGQDFSATFLM